MVGIGTIYFKKSYIFKVNQIPSLLNYHLFLYTETDHITLLVCMHGYKKSPEYAIEYQSYPVVTIYRYLTALGSFGPMKVKDVAEIYVRVIVPQSIPLLELLSNIATEFPITVKKKYLSI